MDINNERAAFLRKVSIFSELESHYLKKIACALTQNTYRAGEKIFAKGEIGYKMYIIAQGKVNVHDGDHVFTSLCKGQFFGEYSFFDSSARTASITAVEDSILLKLEKEDFFKIMSNNTDIIQSVIKSLVNRVKDKDELEEELAKRNVEILQQKEEIEAQRDEIEAQRDEIEEQRDEIEAQRDLATSQRDQIMEQKQEITDSIEYASKIQNAILPGKKAMEKLFPKHFILYKPRDIVSGDFFWAKEIFNGKIVVAVADCTGHGVPGAFMSILGISFLNEVVTKTSFKQPAKILEQLRKKIKKSLKQTGKLNEQKDGMDIALCIIDKKTNLLQFAGAYNPLYLLRKKGETNTPEDLVKAESEDYQLIEIKADRQPIAIHLNEKPFTSHEIELLEGDTIYLFSDGFADQLGGEKNKKFSPKSYRELLLSIQERSMNEQRDTLDRAIESWRLGSIVNASPQEQLDDILVLGIRV